MKTNIIYNKDCIEGMKELPDESIDLVITDPPYGIEYQSNTRSEKFRKLKNDDNLDWLDEFLGELFRVMKSNTFFYCFCRWDVYPIFYNKISKKFNVKNMLVIKKRGNGAGDLNNFANNYELCIFSCKGNPFLNDTKLFKVSETTMKDKRYKGDGFLKRFPALIDFINVSPFNLKLIHPTQKTEEIFEFFIQISSKEDALVLDAFSGSGTFAIASLNTNRQFIGFEIDPQYYKISLERLSDKTSTLPNSNPNGEFNKDLTDFQKENPKCPSDTSLNPDIKSNSEFCSKRLKR
jgi:site-specific DNA-methyltransferase (adenine-specific)